MEEEKKFEQFSERFVLMCVVVALFVGGVSWYLYTLDIPYTENDQIRTYQFTKLQKNTNTNLLIVGDSAAGNAIDAEFFSSLTHTQAMNVALTGSFGIEGSVHMIEQALQAGQPIRYVVIVQTLDMWHRPFSEEGVIDTARGLKTCLFKDMCDKPLAMSRYLFNPKEIYWFARHFLFPPPEFIVENDYRKQYAETFANGGKTLGTVLALPSNVDSSKKEAFRILDSVCESHRLVCVYLHGPLHQEVGTASPEALQNVNAVLASAHTVRSDPSVPLFENAMMGDTVDHVAPSFKTAATKLYAEKFLSLVRDDFAQ